MHIRKTIVKMKFVVFLLLASPWFISAEVDNSTSLEAILASDVEPPELSEIHTRKKRYLVFPKGSSIQLVYCNTYLLKPVVDIFRFGTTGGLAWMLPSEPSDILDRRKHKVFRRSVFQKIEALMYTRGLNGKHCVLRALCESGQRTESKKPFIWEVLHRIFWMEDEEEGETHHDKIYRRAHRSINEDCSKRYPDCGFSVFDFVK